MEQKTKRIVDQLIRDPEHFKKTKDDAIIGWINGTFGTCKTLLHGTVFAPVLHGIETGYFGPAAWYVSLTPSRLVANRYWFRTNRSEDEDACLRSYDDLRKTFKKYCNFISDQAITLTGITLYFNLEDYNWEEVRLLREIRVERALKMTELHPVSILFLIEALELKPSDIEFFSWMRNTIWETLLNA